MKPPSSFTVQYPGITNQLRTNVKIGSAFSNDANTPCKPEEHAALDYVALWDTGATNSLIAKKVVLDSGLAPR
jgi:hypothetical protein